MFGWMAARAVDRLRGLKGPHCLSTPSLACRVPNEERTAGIRRALGAPAGAPVGARNVETSSKSETFLVGPNVRAYEAS